MQLAALCQFELMPADSYDAVIVGSGPNGLTAAVVLASQGLSVAVYEASDHPGGGARTVERTIPGFLHDLCSSVHLLGVGSPIFRSLDLERHGLQWVHPEIPLVHPLLSGEAAVLSRSIEETAASLGEDGKSYTRLLKPFEGHWDAIAHEALAPISVRIPRDPFTLMRFGLLGIRSSRRLANRFETERARALVAGIAAHVMAPVENAVTSGVALLFSVAAHEVGWPFARGGSQAVSDALISRLDQLGGVVVTGTRVADIAQLPAARAYLFDTSPRALATIAGSVLPGRYTARLLRYRHGPAAFKVDYALDEPIPWRAEAARRAGTVHLGGTLEDISAILQGVVRGRAPERPYLIVTQPTAWDPSRAPQGKHVAWAYAHVPNGWDGDLTNAIDAQIERYAPGFRDLVISRASISPLELEAGNANYVGGDIACGAFAGKQTVFRPVLSNYPYSTPNRSIYLCSSATPPGPGVHGMCGYHAARSALRRVFGKRIG